MTRPDHSFTEHDVSKFARFGVDVNLLTEAGIRRVSDAQAREYITGNTPGDLAGLLFPYLDPETHLPVTCRLRRDHPEVDAAGNPQRKYVTAWGDSPHVYFPPGSGPILADSSTSVVLVEAEKSALALTATSRRSTRPMLVIALGGCWGWRTQQAGKATDADGARVNVAGVQPDLGRVAWNGRDVVVLFDANAATNPKVRRARRQLADELTSRGARVQIGTVPAEPGVNGPDDYRAVHDDAALLALIDDAVPVQPATVDELLEDCRALALSKPCNASQVEPVIRAVRDALRGADALRVSAVRSRLVSLLKERGIGDAGRLVDAAIGGKPESAEAAPFLADVEPWPDPVDGGAVLNDVVALLQKYMVLPAHTAEAVALWVLHSYLMNVWSISPILAVLSPTMRCGKSTLFMLLNKLAYRTQIVANLTTAVLFRLMDRFHPTLLADEGDAWLSDEKSDLRGAFNAGWLRDTSMFPRCEGEAFEIKLFSVWGAKAIAAITDSFHKLPSTIEDRSIVVPLRRKTPDEAVGRYRHDHVEAEALPLRRQLRRWANDHEADVTRLDPDDLDQLHDRASDNWRPLRMLALALGGGWPGRADASALALSGVTAEGDDNTGVQLLGDIKAVFEDKDEDALPSSTLAAALAELTDRPWAEWSHGKPLTTNKLARLLAPFGVTPANVRIGAKVPKSYTRHAFGDAWERYLPPETGSQPLHRNKPNESGPESPISKPLQVEVCSGLENEKTPMSPGACYGVAVEKPKTAPATLFEVI
jgi:hypothetical protein